jgi:hypothetical protein
MSEAIYLGARCNIHQHFNIQKLAWTETYYSTDVTFRHAGYNSTKFFYSLELLITPHLTPPPPPKKTPQLPPPEAAAAAALHVLER